MSLLVIVPFTLRIPPAHLTSGCTSTNNIDCAVNIEAPLIATVTASWSSIDGCSLSVVPCHAFRPMMLMKK